MWQLTDLPVLFVVENWTYCSDRDKHRTAKSTSVDGDRLSP